MGFNAIIKFDKLIPRNHGKRHGCHVGDVIKGIENQNWGSVPNDKNQIAMGFFNNMKLNNIPNGKTSPKNDAAHNQAINEIMKSENFVKYSRNVLNDREF